MFNYGDQIDPFSFFNDKYLFQEIGNSNIFYTTGA